LIRAQFLDVVKGLRKSLIGTFGNSKRKKKQLRQYHLLKTKILTFSIMDKIFSNYKINKNIDRTGVNLLMKNIRKRTKYLSSIVYSAYNSNGEQINGRWLVKKQKNGRYKFIPYDEVSEFLRLSLNFKTTILNYLTTSNSVIVILVCNMNQKIDDKKMIREMWGFKVESKGENTILTEITSEDIYKYSTTNAYTGKHIPPQLELVYCGPDGKICGWDMI